MKTTLTTNTDHYTDHYTDKDVTRFIDKVILPDDLNSDDCWIWNGAKHSKNRGYGKFWLDGRTVNAHQASYLLFVGPLEKGMVIGHKCNNERCVNPNHIIQQTQVDNIQYCIACGRHNWFQ